MNARKTVIAAVFVPGLVADVMIVGHEVGTNLQHV